MNEAERRWYRYLLLYVAVPLSLWTHLRAGWMLCNICKHSCLIWCTQSIRDYPAHSPLIICWWWRYTAAPELQISRDYGKQSRRPLSLSPSLSRSRSLSLSLSLSLGSPLLPSPPFPRPSALWDSGTIKYILSRRKIRSPRQEGDEDGGRQAEEEWAVKAMAGLGNGPGASYSEKEEDEGEVRWWRRVSGRLLERRYRGGAPNAWPGRWHQLRQCRRSHRPPPGLCSPAIGVHAGRPALPASLTHKYRFNCSPWNTCQMEAILIPLFTYLAHPSFSTQG